MACKRLGLRWGLGFASGHQRATPNTPSDGVWVQYCWRLVDTDQHAAELNIVGLGTGRPDAVGSGEAICAAVSKPPSGLTHSSAATTIPDVVIAVRCTELHPVSVEESSLCCSHRIPGVSAVSGHTQLILSSLVTDGERRVFCWEPQTAGTLDLSATHHWRAS